jgi:hypothetical protein
MKLQIPDADVNVVADWSELFVLSTALSLSKTELGNYIKTNLTEIEEDEDRTRLVDSAFSELSFRSSSLYGGSSHFKVAGDLIIPLTSLEDSPELGLCLIFSLRGVVVQRGKNNGTKFFEQISNIASEAFAGNSYLVGFPNNSRLNSQIQSVCASNYEPKGHLNPKATDKDGGVDIIAWRGFEDKRSNQIVILIQCGAGKHYDKKKRINIEKWKRWVHWAFEPTTGIITPKIIRDSEEWQELSDYYQMIIDRPRLVRLIKKSTSTDSTLKSEIGQWCLENLN